MEELSRSVVYDVAVVGYETSWGKVNKIIRKSLVKGGAYPLSRAVHSFYFVRGV